MVLKNINPEDKVFCVYILINPINNLPFYIGEGMYPERPYSHWKEFVSFKENGTKQRILLKNNIKFSELCKIYNAGLEPIVKIYANKIDKFQSLKVEKILVNKYGLRIDKTGILTNLTRDQTISPTLYEHNKIRCSEGLKKFYATGKGKIAINKGQIKRKHFYETEDGVEIRKSLSEIGKTLTKEKNPNYGNRWSEEKKDDLKKIKKIQNKGERNPMYARIRITDGIQNKTIEEDKKIPKGWIEGMSEISKEKMRGKINPMTGMKRITNGIEDTVIKEGEILPEGYVFGMKSAYLKLLKKNENN